MPKELNPCSQNDSSASGFYQSLFPRPHHPPRSVRTTCCRVRPGVNPSARRPQRPGPAAVLTRRNKPRRFARPRLTGPSPAALTSLHSSLCSWGRGRPPRFRDLSRGQVLPRHGLGPASRRRKCAPRWPLPPPTLGDGCSASGCRFTAGHLTTSTVTATASREEMAPWLRLRHCLPGARNPEPTRSQGAPWRREGSAQAAINGAEKGCGGTTTSKKTAG